MTRFDEDPIEVEVYRKLSETVISRTIYCGPHCDSLVLHEPGTCEHCDMPEWEDLHNIRANLRLAYTGEKREGFSKCPAEQVRDIETVHHWPGNRPS